MPIIPNNNSNEIKIIKNLLIQHTELLKMLVDDMVTIRKALEKK